VTALADSDSSAPIIVVLNWARDRGDQLGKGADEEIAG
jgi:hypothetical protein